MITPEDKSRLEHQVLKLVPADFHYGGMYPTALFRQAIPVVDLLAQLKDESVVRVNPILAEYSSGRGGDDFLFAHAWNRDLEAAIIDLSFAAGLRVAINYSEGNQFQLPGQFRGLLPNLKLPPTLQRRIDSRRGELDQELDEQIKARGERMERIKNPSMWRSVPIIGDIQDALKQRKHKQEPKLTVPSDFRLIIKFNVDEKSYGSDFQRDTYSYHRLSHAITLVTAQ